MSDEKPKRRIVLPPDAKVSGSPVVVPTLENLLSDALSVIGGELARYAQKSKRGVTLDLKEARAVQGYMNALIQLSKEERERARAEDLANLSDEELKQLANEVLKSGLNQNSNEES